MFDVRGCGALFRTDIPLVLRIVVNQLQTLLGVRPTTNYERGFVAMWDWNDELDELHRRAISESTMPLGLRPGQRRAQRERLMTLIRLAAAVHACSERRGRDGFFFGGSVRDRA